MKNILLILIGVVLGWGGAILKQEQEKSAADLRALALSARTTEDLKDRKDRNDRKDRAEKKVEPVVEQENAQQVKPNDGSKNKNESCSDGEKIAQLLENCQDRLDYLMRNKKMLVSGSGANNLAKPAAAAAAIEMTKEVSFFIDQWEKSEANQKNFPDSFKKGLKEKILHNPRVEYAMSHVAKKMNKEVRKIQGAYKGSVYFLKKRERHEVILDVAMEMVQTETKGKILAGNYRLALARDGNIYSESNGNGDNNSIRMREGAKNELLMEVNGQSFIQIFLSNNNVKGAKNWLNGIFYEEGVPIGIVKLLKE